MLVADVSRNAELQTVGSNVTNLYVTHVKMQLTLDLLLGSLNATFFHWSLVIVE